MNIESQHAFAEVEQISGEMLEQAKSAEWEHVGTLEQRRRQLIATCFPLESSNSENLYMQMRLKRIIELDHQIMELARSRQVELGDLLGRFSQGRKANRAYQDNSSPEQ